MNDLTRLLLEGKHIQLEERIFETLEEGNRETAHYLARHPKTRKRWLEDVEDSQREIL